ncbi:MAG: general secretion pathway protein GspB, partial [Mariprofundaceae bacterium]|nr:general secretion pathway protein GspB [Mariprofundaceae bacterium]
TLPAKPAAAMPMPDIGNTNQVAPLRGELPVRIQQSLPPIDISAHIYDKNPASRMAFINGHIRHEGEEVSPGLKLLSIMPDGVSLSFRGNAFRIRIFRSAAP